MTEELSDEELRELTRRKREAIRQGLWKPVGDVLKEDYEKCKRAREKTRQYLKRRKAREERERQRKARGRGKGKNRRELPKGKFTSIEDDITEAFYKQSWGANQAKIFWYVIRKTWGWQKRSEFIRVTQCAKELGIPKSRVSEALSSLVKRRIVTVNRNKTYAIQMNVGLWKNLYKSKNRT